MISSKKEIPTTGTDLKIRKKTRVKRLIRWLFVDLVVAAAVFGLLRYKTGRFYPRFYIYQS